MNEWEMICKRIRELPGCPVDAEIKLATARDGRVWIDVLSGQLCNETVDEANSCDPIWKQFGIIDDLKTP